MSVASLETCALRKEYPGVVALDDVSVSFAPGRVHALLGKNGAGKSTLVKIFAGSVQPTSGTLKVKGAEVCLRTPQAAFQRGIATVYQELSLVRGLSVAENILLGRLPLRSARPIPRIDWPAARARAQAVLDSMEAGIDCRRLVGDLGVAQQQVVEIAKAMAYNPTVLMLDEPTSALSRHETGMLFMLVRRLAEKGTAIIYITHRLQELAHIADTVTVLRDGRLIGSAEFRDLSPQDIVRMMFGEVIPRRRPSDLVPGKEPLLEVRTLTRAQKFHDVSFTLHKGEVLGIAGMLGSGRTELLRAIFGAEPAQGGSMQLEGRPYSAPTPQVARNAGVAFTPENRKEEALVLGLGTRDNLFLASLRQMAPLGISRAGRERTLAARTIEQLAIKLPHMDLPVETLSGGNQQKVVVGKWILTGPRVFLFDEPTRGIDVLAKQQIFQVMWDLAAKGLGCIFVSSELEELVDVCHRILVMQHGSITGEVNPSDITADELVVRCMG